jgi:hypothetical protein
MRFRFHVVKFDETLEWCCCGDGKGRPSRRTRCVWRVVAVLGCMLRGLAASNSKRKRKVHWTKLRRLNSADGVQEKIEMQSGQGQRHNSTESKAVTTTSHPYQNSCLHSPLAYRYHMQTSKSQKTPFQKQKLIHKPILIISSTARAT